jgi:hypothetical protein
MNTLYQPSEKRNEKNEIKNLYYGGRHWKEIRQTHWIPTQPQKLQVIPFTPEFVIQILLDDNE